MHTLHGYELSESHGVCPHILQILEKVMATHCSALACTIPRTGEPGGLQSTGSQRAATTERLTHTHSGYSTRAVV